MQVNPICHSGYQCECGNFEGRESLVSFSCEQNQGWKEGIERPYLHVDVPGSLEQQKE